MALGGGFCDVSIVAAVTRALHPKSAQYPHYRTPPPQPRLLIVIIIIIINTTDDEISPSLHNTTSINLIKH